MLTPIVRPLHVRQATAHPVSVLRPLPPITPAPREVIQ